MTISEALEPTGIACTHPPYQGDADQYVTYQLIGQSGILYAEGAERETGVAYAVDLYVRGDYIDTMLTVKAALERGGYIVTIDVEYLEEDLEYYHISMTATREGAVYG